MVKLDKQINLERFEKELIEEIERDEWKPVDNIDEEKRKLKKAVKNKYKKKTISIRVSEFDIAKLKLKFDTWELNLTPSAV